MIATHTLWRMITPPPPSPLVSVPVYVLLFTQSTLRTAVIIQAWCQTVVSLQYETRTCQIYCYSGCLTYPTAVGAICTWIWTPSPGLPSASPLPATLGYWRPPPLPARRWLTEWRMIERASPLVRHYAWHWLIDEWRRSLAWHSFEWVYIINQYYWQ